MTLGPSYDNSITKARTRKVQLSLHGENNDYEKTRLSPALERKWEDITAGIKLVYLRVLRTISHENASTIADYILAMKTETNLSDHYRHDNIVALCRFSKYCSNAPFKVAIKRDNVISFLESFRRPENADPLHKWI
jgi:hypothetical protein